MTKETIINLSVCVYVLYFMFAIIFAQYLIIWPQFLVPYGLSLYFLWIVLYPLLCLYLAEDQ